MCILLGILTQCTMSRARPTTASAANDERFDSIQQQISKIEEARAADAARLDAELAQERAKRSDLQASHEALSRELTNAKTQELAQRQELFIASDELNSLRQRHEREISELQADLRRKDRELRELNEDLRMYQSDLERERETVRGLKATITQQATAQVSLTAQLGALQAEKAAVQVEFDRTCGSKADLALQFERAQKRIAELECETREGEMVRRKLHNMVQELKGNIRVFVRVRPVLRSDIVSSTLHSSGSSVSAITDGTDSPDLQEEAKRREEAMAQLVYPDKMDHREIVLKSSSESATGQERKDEWQFAFDRVSVQIDIVRQNSHIVCRSSSPTPPRLKSSRRSHNSRRAARMVTTSACSPMAKPVLASRSRWRAVQYVLLQNLLSLNEPSDNVMSSLRPVPV